MASRHRLKIRPTARRQTAKPPSPNSHPNEPQGWMTDGRGHVTHLAIFSFNQFQTEPARGHGLAKTNRRMAGRDFRLRFQDPRAAGKGVAALNRYAFSEPAQCFRRGNYSNLRPVVSVVRMPLMEQ